MRYAKSHPGKDKKQLDRGDDQVGTPRKGWRPIQREKKAWAQTQSLTAELHVGRIGQHESEAEFRGAENVGLLIKAGRSSVWLSLQSLTAEELRVMREVVLLAFDTAAPVCAFLDEKAQEALDRGDDELPPRLFRLTPSLFVKENIKAFVPTDTGEQDETNHTGGRDPSDAGAHEAPGEERSHDQGIQF